MEHRNNDIERFRAKVKELEQLLETSKEEKAILEGQMHDLPSAEEFEILITEKENLSVIITSLKTRSKELQVELERLRMLTPINEDKDEKNENKSNEEPMLNIVSTGTEEAISVSSFFNETFDNSTSSRFDESVFVPTSTTTIAENKDAVLRETAATDLSGTALVPEASGVLRGRAAGGRPWEQ